MDLQFTQQVIMLRTDSATTFFKLITNLGGLEIALAIFFLLTIFFLIKKKFSFAVLITLSLGISELTAYLLKEYFARLRPSSELTLIKLTDYSFPSGHTIIAFGFYLMATLLLIKMIKGFNVKIVCWIIWLILAFLIAFSRIYLGVHWLTDVLASIVLGVFINYILIKLYSYRSKIKRRFSKS